MGVFSTSDGSLFDDRPAAIDHETAIARRNAVDAFCADAFFKGMSRDEVAKMLIDHREHLLDILA